MPGGVDYSNYDREFDNVRRTKKPPVPVVKQDTIVVSTAPDTRSLATVVGKQGNTTVLQHPDGKQTVVGEQGLRDKGIKP